MASGLVLFRQVSEPTDWEPQAVSRVLRAFRPTDDLWISGQTLRERLGLAQPSEARTWLNLIRDSTRAGLVVAAERTHFFGHARVVFYRLN